MKDEIKRLGILVNQFNHSFETDPTSIETYKQELYTHIANGLKRNLTERCGSALSQSIDETKQSMTGKQKFTLQFVFYAILYEVPFYVTVLTI